MPRVLFEFGHTGIIQTAHTNRRSESAPLAFTAGEISMSIRSTRMEVYRSSDSSLTPHQSIEFSKCLEQRSAPAHTTIATTAYMVRSSPDTTSQLDVVRRSSHPLSRLLATNNIMKHNIHPPVQLRPPTPPHPTPPHRMSS